MTITEQIKSDLARHLQQGEAGLPCKLTLNALARHYKVSMTPVRMAVDDLIKQGVIRRLDNGRLYPGDSDSATDSITLGVFADEPVAIPRYFELEAFIRREVVQRSLRQDRSFLREQATAQQFDIGRTAVRQIFSRLAGAGILEHVPRRGWQVKPYSASDMVDYLVVRETLELKAIDLARDRFVTDELEALWQANQPDQSHIPRLDFDLHDYWIERCGNHYIRVFFKRYSEFYNTLFNSAVLDDNVKSDMAQEHCEIIAALLVKDWRGARRTLSRHIADQKNNVERLLISLRD